MIPIAVIDDDEDFTLLVKNKIMEDYRFKNDVEVDVYTNPLEFLEQVEAGKHYDIFFSDIEMPEMDGIDLAEKIRLLNPNSLLVLLSAYSKYVFNGYQVRAFDYLMKNNFDQSWKELAPRLIDELESRAEKIYWVKQTNGVEKILVDNIIYISKYKNYVEIVIEGESSAVKERKSMKEVYGELEKYKFIIQVKKGILINLKKIKRTTASDILLINGESIHIGRNYVRSVRKKVMDYVNGEM